jgi:rhomboid protease GluP
MTGRTLEQNKSSLPIATIVVLAITALVTAMQFVFPPLLPALRRQPTAIAGHGYWRLITALFVHADGWKQIAFNFPAIAVVGVLVERIFGSSHWLILYFVSGVATEFIALRWEPYGGGASIAGAGLLGALAIWLLLKNKRPQDWGGALFILIGAVVLTYLRNIHGPPIFMGAGMAVVMLKRMK